MNIHFKYRMILFARFVIIIFIAGLSDIYSKPDKISIENIFDNAIKYKNTKLLSSYNDIRIQGNIVFDKKLPSNFEYFFLRPNFGRIKTSNKNITTNLIQVADSGWIKQGIFPTLAIDDIPRAHFYILHSILIHDFYEYKKNGYEIERMPNTTVLGKSCFYLRMKDSLGILSDVYISDSTYDIIKFSQIREINKEALLFEIYYDNYKDFSGCRIATNIEAFLGDKEVKFNINEINYNLGLSQFDFRKPD